MEEGAEWGLWAGGEKQGYMIFARHDVQKRVAGETFAGGGGCEMLTQGMLTLYYIWKVDGRGGE